MRFPFTIETSSGGFYVNGIGDLKRLAKEEANLSTGFILEAEDSVLLSIVLRKVGGEVIDS